MEAVLTERFASGQGELPGTDGIYRPDGTVVVLNPYFLEDDTGVTAFCSPLCDTTIASLEHRLGNDVWTPVDTYTKRLELSSGMIGFAGAGAMGSDGFIAVETRNGDLLWAAFFTRSNPFVELWEEEGVLVARSEHAPEHGPMYRMHPENPERIAITMPA